MKDIAVEGMASDGIAVGDDAVDDNPFRDVAARAQQAQTLVDVLRAERERLAILVETLRDGVVLLDAERRVTVVNHAFQELASMAGHRLGPSMNWEALLAEVQPLLADGPAAAGRLRDAVAQPRAVIGEEIAFGSGRVVEVDVMPVEREGRRWGTIVQARDITARAKVSRAQQKHNRAPIEAANTPNQFVSTVAHELRGPLSSVVSFAHLLGEAEAGPLNGDQRSYLEVIERNANRLLRIIEDLLLLSRLESRTLSLRLAPVHVADLVESVMAERRPAAASAELVLEVDVADGPPLVCDETRVQQLLGNLIGNAVKFTPTGGSVAVRAKATGATWHIEVSDTGIGIPEAELPQVFSAFFRGSNFAAAPSRPGTPGSGLGLVTSRAIAELHGGSIQVASTDGAGTTVTVSLPARPARQTEVDREPTAGS